MIRFRCDFAYRNALTRKALKTLARRKLAGQGRRFILRSLTYFLPFSVEEQSECVFHIWKVQGDGFEHINGEENPSISSQIYFVVVAA